LTTHIFLNFKTNKMTNTQIIKIENEILNCIKTITLENKNKGYDWHISNYKNSVFQAKLSIKAFTYLSSGLSNHGKFSCYGGHWGSPYMALNYKS
jgi:hypothetical protein